MGGGSGGGGGGTTTVKNKPWGEAIPDLKEILGEASSIYNQGPAQYYPESTVTPQLQTSQDAINALIQRGLSGSPVTNAAQSNITSTLNGDYLDPTSNPFWGNLSQGVIDQVMPNVNATFGAAGRTGGGLNQQALAQGLSQGIGQVGAGIYNQERANQLSAAGMAPDLANQDYVNIGNALQGSQQQEQYNQQQLNDLVNRWNFGQNADWSNLGQYSSIVTPIGGLGGTQSTTTPNQGGGILSGLLGTALVGSNIYSNLASGGLFGVKSSAG